MTDVIHPHVQEMIDNDPSTEFFGFTVISAAAGQAVLSLAVTDTMVNGLNITHGGIVFALADTAFAYAANSLAPNSATVDAAITYLAPSRKGQLLTAEAVTVFSDSRRTAIDVEVRTENDVIALFRGNARVFK